LTAEVATVVIDLAKGLIAPAMIYAVYPVLRISRERISLKNGACLNLPGHALDSATEYLTAVVCSIGAALETNCRQFADHGDLLKSLFLDAAGVATLEALGERSYEVLSMRAQSLGLFAGCRFAPGYGTMPMSTQSLLFSLVDGGAIGVRLNARMIMKPSKSLSFFVGFTSEAAAERNLYKCRACSIRGCKFRLVDEGGLNEFPPGRKS
jgi:hypothetical protein